MYWELNSSIFRIIAIKHDDWFAFSYIKYHEVLIFNLEKNLIKLNQLTQFFLCFFSSHFPFCVDNSLIRMHQRAIETVQWVVLFIHFLSGSRLVDGTANLQEYGSTIIVGENAWRAQVMPHFLNISRGDLELFIDWHLSAHWAVH